MKRKGPRAVKYRPTGQWDEFTPAAGTCRGPPHQKHRARSAHAADEVFTGTGAILIRQYRNPTLIAPWPARVRDFHRLLVTIGALLAVKADAAHDRRPEKPTCYSIGQSIRAAPIIPHINQQAGEFPELFQGRSRSAPTGRPRLRAASSKFGCSQHRRTRTVPRWGQRKTGGIRATRAATAWCGCIPVPAFPHSLGCRAGRGAGPGFRASPSKRLSQAHAWRAYRVAPRATARLC